MAVYCFAYCSVEAVVVVLMLVVVAVVVGLVVVVVLLVLVYYDRCLRLRHLLLLLKLLE